MHLPAHLMTTIDWDKNVLTKNLFMESFNQLTFLPASTVPSQHKLPLFSFTLKKRPKKSFLHKKTTLLLITSLLAHNCIMETYKLFPNYFKIPTSAFASQGQYLPVPAKNDYLHIYYFFFFCCSNYHYSERYKTSSQMLIYIS